MQSSWRTAQLGAIDTGTGGAVESDDDGSLYRLFGFSLFVAMQHKKRSIYGRLRRRYLPCTRTRYGHELQLLKKLVATDKSDLPAVIKAQDRGKMTFPHQALLPFMRKCSIAIKSQLNRKQYMLHGRKVILLTKQQILSDQELLSSFNTLITFHSGVIDTSVVAGVFRDLVRCVINTMANSFLSSQDMLERISRNKGVDAEMTLRDKLKAYATDTNTQIKL